jgi:hypothetical protein
MAGSRLVTLLNNDPNFFYYNGNNNGGTGKFSQKSIKYGRDRRGNGDSGQPYITTPIPLRLAQSIADDGLVRGGVVTADRAAQIDTERINRFLKDKPRGPLFIQRQVKLQFSNPKLEVKKFRGSGEGIPGIISSAAAGLFNVVNELAPGPTRLYNNGFNTIAQIGATAFGQHFDRHGLTPVQDDNTKYLAVAKHNNENGTNRLVELKNQLIKPVENPQNFLNSANFIINNINALFKTNIPTKGLQPQDLQIANYLGGPGSIYGNGRTIIRRFDITSNGYNKPIPEKGKIDYEGALGVSNQWNNSATDSTLSTLFQFAGTGLNVEASNENIFFPGGNNGNFEQINNTAVNYKQNTPAGANGTISSPTSRKYDELQSQIATQSSKKTTIINGLSDNAEVSPDAIIINKNTKDFKYHGKSLDNIVSRKDADIMSVIFRIVNPFATNPGDDSQLDDIVFSAYINGFRDNFDATWNEYNYVGRSESFYTYGKFKRNVNFNLDIPCFNRAELQLKHRALGQLASTTAGAYNGNNLLGGVLIKLYIGKYIYGQYGILNNLSYEIPQDASWDINERLAMTIKTSFNFTIVQANLPQYKRGEGFFNYINKPTSNVDDLVTKFTAR